MYIMEKWENKSKKTQEKQATVIIILLASDNY